MKKLTQNFLIFATAFLLFLTSVANSVYGQSTIATEEQIKQLSQAINRGDLAAVRDLIDNKCVDVNVTLYIASTTGKEKITPLMQAILRWSFYEIDPPSPEIVKFLLERGADFRVKQGGETLLEKTNYALYTLNSWKEEARKQGKVQYDNMTKSFPEWISATEQVIELIKQYESGNQVIKQSPSCRNKDTQKKDEEISTSDWVQNLMSNSKTIYIRNNSKTKAVRITSLEIYDCNNLLVAECGNSLINQIIPAGETISIRSVSRSDDKRAFSFSYRYWAEFVNRR